MPRNLKLEFAKADDASTSEQNPIKNNYLESLKPTKQDSPRFDTDDKVRVSQYITSDSPGVFHTKSYSIIERTPSADWQQQTTISLGHMYNLDP